MGEEQIAFVLVANGRGHTDFFFFPEVFGGEISKRKLCAVLMNLD